MHQSPGLFEFYPFVLSQETLSLGLAIFLYTRSQCAEHLFEQISEPDRSRVGIIQAMLATLRNLVPILSIPNLSNQQWPELKSQCASDRVFINGVRRGVFAFPVY